MGKFDKVLLCSDWDGTICDEGEILRDNVEAIRYFQSEGGFFTFASGRSVWHLKKFEKDIRPNAPVICAGGSCIMDGEGNIYYERFCNERFSEYAKLLMSEDSPYLQAQISVKGAEPYIVDKKTIHSKEAEQYLYSKQIYKAIFLTYPTDENAAAALAFSKGLRFDGYLPVRSFPFSIELIPGDGGKGRAVRWLANHLGARLAVTVGDYENDCDMLRMADYGYAVSGGSPLARAAANRFAATVKAGAVASVIEELDKEY